MCYTFKLISTTHRKVINYEKDDLILISAKKIFKGGEFFEIDKNQLKNIVNWEIVNEQEIEINNVSHFIDVVDKKSSGFNWAGYFLKKKKSLHFSQNQNFKEKKKDEHLDDYFVFYLPKFVALKYFQIISDGIYDQTIFALSDLEILNIYFSEIHFLLCTFFPNWSPIVHDLIKKLNTIYNSISTSESLQKVFNSLISVAQNHHLDYDSSFFFQNTTTIIKKFQKIDFNSLK